MTPFVANISSSTHFSLFVPNHNSPCCMCTVCVCVADFPKYVARHGKSWNAADQKLTRCQNIRLHGTTPEKPMKNYHISIWWGRLLLPFMLFRVLKHLFDTKIAYSYDARVAFTWKCWLTDSAPAAIRKINNPFESKMSSIYISFPGASFKIDGLERVVIPRWLCNWKVSRANVRGIERNSNNYGNCNCPF